MLHTLYCLNGLGIYVADTSQFSPPQHINTSTLIPTLLTSPTYQRHKQYIKGNPPNPSSTTPSHKLATLLLPTISLKPQTTTIKHSKPQLQTHPSTNLNLKPCPLHPPNSPTSSPPAPPSTPPCPTSATPTLHAPNPARPPTPAAKPPPYKTASASPLCPPPPAPPPTYSPPSNPALPASLPRS